MAGGVGRCCELGKSRLRGRTCCRGSHEGRPRLQPHARLPSQPLARAQGENAGEYILILCNAIGSPVDSKYIEVRLRLLNPHPHANPCPANACQRGAKSVLLSAPPARKLLGPVLAVPVAAGGAQAPDHHQPPRHCGVGRPRVRVAVPHLLLQDPLHRRVGRQAQGRAGKGLPHRQPQPSAGPLPPNPDPNPNPDPACRSVPCPALLRAALPLHPAALASSAAHALLPAAQLPSLLSFLMPVPVALAPKNALHAHA